MPIERKRYNYFNRLRAMVEPVQTEMTNPMLNGFQRKILLTAQANPEPLTLWECDFIDSVLNNFSGRPITERQNKIINRIGQLYL